MSKCCSNSSHFALSQACPGCGQECKNVETRTLYHQIKYPENIKIKSDRYFFCPHKHCVVGYFSSAGSVIPKNHFRTQNEINNDRLCFCFGIDAMQYQAALKNQLSEVIKRFVIDKTQSGVCACEIRNPSGQCCLAHFKQLEKQYKAETARPG